MKSRNHQPGFVFRSARRAKYNRSSKSRVPLLSSFAAVITAGISFPGSAFAVGTNPFSNNLTAQSLPDAGPSLLRVLGALALVLGIFLGGAWIVRNGRFAPFSRSRTNRLNVLETRSLGGRQSLHVVAYGQERFLIGATPAGINLLSHLASSSDTEELVPAQAGNNLSFAQAFAQVLKGQKNIPGKPGGAA